MTWLESLEEHINDVIEQNGLDPKEAWDEVMSMGAANRGGVVAIETIT